MMTRFPVFVALLVAAVSLVATATYFIERDAAPDLSADPAGAAAILPATEAPSEGCSACDARHQRLQRNRQGEE